MLLGFDKQFDADWGGVLRFAVYRIASPFNQLSIEFLNLTVLAVMFGVRTSSKHRWVISSTATSFNVRDCRQTFSDHQEHQC